MTEQRNRPRLEVCLEARCEGSTGNHPVRITDLSEEGCYVDNIGEALKGEVISLDVVLPGGEQLKLNGEVTHHEPGIGFGIRFAELSEDRKQKLRSLMGRRIG